MPDNPDFIRIKISGSLEVMSPLHIGDGERQDTVRDEDGKVASGITITLCKDNDGNPYIPASTLRGFLYRRIDNINIRNSLFGLTHDKNGQNVAGKLRVFDARFKSAKTDTSTITIQSRSRINEVTGTNLQSHLYSLELVTEGVQFEWTIEADRISEKELETLRLALMEIDGTHHSQVGKNKSLLQGRIKWAESELTGIKRDHFREWLNDDEKDEEIKIGLYQVLTIDRPEKKQGQQTSSFILDIKILPEGPLLINDTSLVKNNDDKITYPDFEFTRTSDNRLKIPASTLKGMVRARARKILMTLVSHYSNSLPTVELNKIVDPLLQDIFGSTEKMSSFTISDAIAGENDTTEHLQNFNAIDRFSGGVVDGALYQAKAAYSKSLSCQCRIHYGQIQTQRLDLESYAGLFLLILKDALQGGFSVGWGKSKGYGQIRFEVKTGSDEFITNWSGLIKKITTESRLDNANNCLNQLRRSLRNCTTENSPGAV